MSVNIEATPSSGPFPDSPSDPTYVRAKRIANGIERGVVDVWLFFRFLLFVFYLLFAIVAFWLWLLSAALGLLRLGLRMVMAILLFLAGGSAPRYDRPAPNLIAAIDREVKYLWSTRLVAYENLARPVARHFLAAKQAGRTFWHWSILHKASATVVALIFIAIPMLYVVPRAHYVQITDDNAVHYEGSDATKVTYLVHATDLANHSKTREYRNEDMWWLGKINSQGLKSQLQPGRFYKLWVVGIRWYYMPRLFPNIISATEIDAQGNPIDDPSRLLAVPPQTQAAPPR